MKAEEDGGIARSAALPSEMDLISVWCASAAAPRRRLSKYGSIRQRALANVDERQNIGRAWRGRRAPGTAAEYSNPGTYRWTRADALGLVTC